VACDRLRVPRSDERLLESGRECAAEEGV